MATIRRGIFRSEKRLTWRTRIRGPRRSDFSPALTAGGQATIVLTHGELAIANSMAIHGPGAYLLTIDASGNDPTPDSTLSDGVATNDGDGSRVLNIDDNSPAVRNVEIIGLRLTGGDVQQYGGGILARGNLLFGESILDGNSSSSEGGGIFSFSAAGSSSSLIIVDSVVSDNATGYEGGGIRKVIGDLTVGRSVVEDNQAGDTGGGISAANELVEVLIRDSLIQRNRHCESFVWWGWRLSIRRGCDDHKFVDCGERGGSRRRSHGGDLVAFKRSPRLSAIARSVKMSPGKRPAASTQSADEVTVSHCTIANNSLAGVWGVDHVDSTIVAGNGSAGSYGSDGFNLASASSAGILGPLFGAGKHVYLDGSRTRVHALLPGSPAIDAGDPSATAGVGNVPEFDHRAHLTVVWWTATPCPARGSTLGPMSVSQAKS